MAKMQGDAVLSVLSSPIKTGKEDASKEKGLTGEERRKNFEVTKVVDTRSTQVSKFK